MGIYNTIHQHDPDLALARLRAQPVPCKHHGEKYRRDDTWLAGTYSREDLAVIAEGWVCRRCGNRAIRLRYPQ